MSGRIAFCLAGRVSTASGGLKVVFDYANELARRGHDVSLLLPMAFPWKFTNCVGKIKLLLKFAYLFFVKAARRPRWFDLDERIGIRVVIPFLKKSIPSADVYIATIVDTALFLESLKTNAKNAYLIQGLEDWAIPRRFVFDTYRYPFEKIVVSRWLKELVDRYSPNRANLVYNGYDFSTWGCDVDPSKRCAHRVCVMYHVDSIKGFDVAYQVLLELRKRIPDLLVKVFGVYRCPKGLPEWMEYTFCPREEDLRKIYNDSEVYLACSRTEGWGLTIGEAMACGCAICCTDTLGYREMVRHEYSGLIAQCDDVGALTDNACRLLNDAPLRSEIATRALKEITRFDKKRSTESFCQHIERMLHETNCEESEK